MFLIVSFYNLSNLIPMTVLLFQIFFKMIKSRIDNLKNLSISFRLSNLLTDNCSQYPLMLFCITMVLIAIFPLHFQFYLFGFSFLDESGCTLSILFIISKNQLLVSLIFAIVFWSLFHFISALIFISFFLFINFGFSFFFKFNFILFLTGNGTMCILNLSGFQILPNPLKYRWREILNKSASRKHSAIKDDPQSLAPICIFSADHPVRKK